MRVAVLAIVGLLLFVPLAPGGEAPTMESLLKAPGQDVALLLGTSDYAAGDVRVSFLLVPNGQDVKPVAQPRLRVWVGAGLKAQPLVTTVARLEGVGVPGTSESAAGDVTQLYVTRLRLRKSGTYRIVVEPIGGPRLQGFQDLVVKAHTASPAVGSMAIPSRTPTIASVHGKLSKLSTQRPPDRGLLRYSVRDTLRAHKPFVLVFATPQFCASRTCGPVVDVVSAARHRYERRGIRFIHVEIYEGNNPANGPNRWVREWRLPSEPWIFLVGADGCIKAKFEGSVSLDELTAAVRVKLL